MLEAAESRGVDWFIMRIAGSKEFGGSPAAIRGWSYADALEAHLTLDAFIDLKVVHAHAEQQQRGSR